MKKLKFIFTALLVLGLVIGAYALTTASAFAVTADCCCKDSCPMKNKDASKTAEANSCCCGDSCPMKSKDNSGSNGKKDCCEGKDSCPMKKKQETS